MNSSLLNSPKALGRMQIKVITSPKSHSQQYVAWAEAHQPKGTTLNYIIWQLEKPFKSINCKLLTILHCPLSLLYSTPPPPPSRPFTTLYYCVSPTASALTLGVNAEQFHRINNSVIMPILCCCYPCPMICIFWAAVPSTSISAPLSHLRPSVEHITLQVLLLTFQLYYYYYVLWDVLLTSIMTILYPSLSLPFT